MRAPAFLLGGGFVVLLWLLLVPWDLSEMRVALEAGQVLEGGERFRTVGGDDYGPRIAFVLGLATVAATALAVRRPAPAIRFAIGGAIFWAALFAWRAGTAKPISGANFWLVAFLMMVLPGVVLSVVIVFAVAVFASRAASKRQSLTPPTEEKYG